jgi:hypothetical protein
MAFSADGRYAIAWADATKIKTTPPKTQGFQDITVLDLVNGTSTILAVGYRPVLVGFAANAPRAYAVTQDGVAIVDVPNATLTKNVLISDTPTEDPGTRDVFVTKDGNNAYIRRDNSNVPESSRYLSQERNARAIDSVVIRDEYPHRAAHFSVSNTNEQSNSGESASNLITVQAPICH